MVPTQSPKNVLGNQDFSLIFWDYVRYREDCQQIVLIDTPNSRA